MGTATPPAPWAVWHLGGRVSDPADSLYEPVRTRRLPRWPRQPPIRCPPSSHPSWRRLVPDSNRRPTASTTKLPSSTSRPRSRVPPSRRLGWGSASLRPTPPPSRWRSAKVTDRSWWSSGSQVPTSPTDPGRLTAARGDNRRCAEPEPIAVDVRAALPRSRAGVRIASRRPGGSPDLAAQPLDQRLPRAAWARSMASNRALKLPAPKPVAPSRWMISKNTVGRSQTVSVKICSR